MTHLFDRVTTSSLTEAEVKYNSLVEKTILLEQEIEEKETLQEEMQRNRDEIRGLEVTLFLSHDSKIQDPGILFPVRPAARASYLAVKADPAAGTS